ncbi:GNAT family N-acetyltransferase [Hymenobacter convexus]|uniref:GNAT family N-acetyltransferase n=1 Tax=Hymenobacter sp. CA1UV-4 TaxID=3063782 RepID=UPI0027133329|nr:GNAT family N-acetyltransferase [Hymenobacter sp. CA1UV-4]MDO7854779.1 GNAT family N-acetyltransferase [Hymenobacter sp. CA1UV-4]
MNTGFSILAGRVRLRHLRPADLPVFAAYRADPSVCRFQGFDPFSEAQAIGFIARHTAADIPAAPGEWVQIAIARSANDELLGDCALHLLAHEPRIAEIGITLAPQQQGRGYASEALRGLLRFCFEELGLHRVVALVDPRNAPSVALMERVGMRREGHFRQNGWYKGEWCDEYQYALLAADWAAAG